MKGLEMKYFVLNPNKKGAYGLASRRAIHAYAQLIEPTNHELSEDLHSWINKISHRLIDEKTNETP